MFITARTNCSASRVRLGSLDVPPAGFDAGPAARVLGTSRESGTITRRPPTAVAEPRERGRRLRLVFLGFPGARLEFVFPRLVAARHAGDLGIFVDTLITLDQPGGLHR